MTAPSPAWAPTDGFACFEGGPRIDLVVEYEGDATRPWADTWADTLAFLGETAERDGEDLTIVAVELARNHDGPVIRLACQR